MLIVPKPIAEQHARMAELAMLHGNRDQAVWAIDRAFAMAAECIKPVSRKSHVSEVVSVKHAAILESMGVETVGQLCRMTAEDLASIAQVRARTVEIIEAQLNKVGYSLAKKQC